MTPDVTVPSRTMVDPETIEVLPWQPLEGVAGVTDLRDGRPTESAAGSHRSDDR
jgi:hypothetical protein